MKFQSFFDRLVVGAETPTSFVPAGTLTAEEAFYVYSQGYIARLTEALGETYESIWRFLGDENFFDLCETYIQQNPSKFYNLSAYGENFPEFVASDNFPFLQDLARFNWLHQSLFHQKTETGMTGEQLQAVLQESSRLSFVSSFCFFKTEWNVFEIWQALKNEQEPLPEKISQTLCLYKQDDQVYVQVFRGEAHAPLLALQQNQKLSEAFSQSDTVVVTELFAFFSDTQIIKQLF
jgi:hypothetical protein